MPVWPVCFNWKLSAGTWYLISFFFFCSFFVFPRRSTWWAPGARPRKLGAAAWGLRRAAPGASTGTTWLTTPGSRRPCGTTSVRFSKGYDFPSPSPLYTYRSGVLYAPLLLSVFCRRTRTQRCLLLVLLASFGHPWIRCSSVLYRV